jgi:predicted TIM-barrel fold metal-dependent hydrolase
VGVEIIDAHVHLYPLAANGDPAGWAIAHGEAHWAQLCTRRRKDGRPVQEFPSLDDLLRDMDKAGIGRAVLLGWYWERPETCAMQNRFYADCIRAHPERLSAFATIHPAAGLEKTLGEVRLAADAGFIGLGELSPHSQGYAPDDPVFRAVLEEADKQGLAVNLHVTDPASKPYPGRVETPLSDFLKLARDFPRTNFILAHWGGGLAWSAEAVALPNVWFDTAASPLLYDSEVWTKGPPGRVLFGSDYPLVLYPKAATDHSFTRIVTEAKTAAAETAMFRNNAAKLLGLG